MHPILFDLGTWTVPLVGPVHLFLPTYGLLFASGAALAWWWFARRAASLGVAADAAFNLAFYSLVGGLVGAKVALVALDWRYYASNPRDLLGVVRTAGVLLGGLAVGALVFVLYAARQGLPLRRLGDAIAAPLALAQGIGRLGCFAAGCCWGVESTAWCAVSFRDPAAAAQTGVPLGVPLLPVQLFQAAFDLSLAALLTWLWRRRGLAAGSVFWWFALLYGLGRGTLEFWRGDTQRGLWFGGSVSTSQILSAAAVVLAAGFLIRGRDSGARGGPA